MKVFPMLCFTKLFIVTFCPSDKPLCKILCCDFCPVTFCPICFVKMQNLTCDFSSVTFCLWLFVLWLSVLHSWFFVSFRIFFSDNTRVRIFIFFVANLTLGCMTKTESDYFFSSTKIRIFFSATLGIRIFF